MTLNEFSAMFGPAKHPLADKPPVTIPAALAYDILRTLQDAATNDSRMLGLFGDAIAAGECEDCRLDFFDKRFAEAIQLAGDAKHNVSVYRHFAKSLATALAAKPAGEIEARIHRFGEIASELTALAPRSNDDPRITKLLHEANAIAKGLGPLSRGLPAEQCRLIDQARADRLAMLRAEHADAMLHDKTIRAEDIACEIEALGGAIKPEVEIAAARKALDELTAEIESAAKRGSINGPAGRNFRTRWREAIAKLARLGVTVTNTSGIEKILAGALGSKA